MEKDDETAARWIARWLDGVAAGRNTMSQRAMSTIEAQGGLEHAVAAAQARGVHLVALTDDRGNAIVAASRHPFRTLC